MAPIPKDEYCPRLREEIKSGGFWRDLFSELVATFLFVTLVTFLRQDTSTNPLQLGLGVAFIWAAVGYGLGDFGGAHMNSAVTMAMMIRAEISFVKALFYWVLQTAAALAGYYFVEAATGTTPPGFVYVGVTWWWQGLLVEAVVTLVLCLAALGTGNIPRKGYIILQSIPVGLAAGVGTFVAYTRTGACMSPTQALGYQIMATIKDNSSDWSNHWYFWAGPMCGAILAAALYWIFDIIDKPALQSTYNTWTYADAKNKQKSMSKEPLTQNRFEDDDYPGRRSPPHHSHRGYNAY